jgi:hypothetical protein
MTRKGLATKRIFNDKRPKTHVSLKGKKKELKLHKKKVLVKLTQQTKNVLKMVC